MIRALQALQGLLEPLERQAQCQDLLVLLGQRVILDLPVQQVRQVLPVRQVTQGQLALRVQPVLLVQQVPQVRQAQAQQRFQIF